MSGVVWHPDDRRVYWQWDATAIIEASEHRAARENLIITTTSTASRRPSFNCCAS